MKSILILWMVAFLSITSYAQKKADLKLNLELNKTYRLKSTALSTVSLTVQGNDMNIESENIQVVSIKATKKEADYFDAELRFDTIKSKTSMPPMEINSANDGDISSQDMGTALNGLINRLCESVFSVKLSYSGQLLDIYNFNEITSSISKGIDTLTGQTGLTLQTKVKNFTTKKAVKGMIENITLNMPGEVVKIDNSWESNYITSNDGMELKISNTQKLKSLENGTATIAGNMVIEPAVANTQFDLRGLGKSTQTVDINTGWVISGSSKSNLQGIVKGMEVTVIGENKTIDLTD